MLSFISVFLLSLFFLYFSNRYLYIPFCICRTPLHCAAFYNDVDLCTFLVEHGASVFAMTYSDRQTAAEKCSRLEENYDQCFGYLHGLSFISVTIHLFLEPIDAEKNIVSIF